MTQEDIAQILSLTEAAGVAWMRGDWVGGYGALLTHQSDASIYGPFGGPAVVGTDSWASRGSAAVRQFRNGESRLTLVQAHASGDLLVLVLLEEQAGEIAGGERHPWSLRVTQVYRREDGGWRVIHRHADPLVQLRTMEETLLLAAAPKG
jgi:ketosteroid isomerase-like protein